MAKCGTRAGYRAHQRAGETPCPGCKQANAHYMRDKRRAAKMGDAGGTAAKRSAPSTTSRVVVTPRTGAVPPASPAAPVEATETPTATTPPAPAERPPLAVVAPDPAASDDTAAPRYLNRVGRDLWDAVMDEYTLSAAARVLLAEACRTADRMERMAAALSSSNTLWFELDTDVDDLSDGVPVVVNGMIAEARQLQTTLGRTLAQLGVATVLIQEREEDGPTSVADMLAARRAEREAASS